MVTQEEQAFLDRVIAEGAASWTLRREVRSRTQMTFGQLISRLYELPLGMRIGLGEPDSYRGYYTDIALSPIDGCTVAILLVECLEMMMHGTMTGYRGGEYSVNENVPVWISEYGRASGLKLISIEDDGNLIIEQEEE